MDAPLWLRQTNGVNFRAQLLPRNDGRLILWVVESESEVYTVTFVRVLAADVYAADAASPEVHKAVLLLEGKQTDTEDDDEDDDDDDGVTTVEIGSFDRDTALRFLSWLQEGITASRRASSSRARGR